ncbi:hypothetical protein B296_00030950 [Ensete ventricosum]|uniref:DUF834 domain-containing protein n=1 Tax=Ensete ventricosum TaxID=4639 RepID=A0A426ZM69_ENSVE|nr:hypothetical protein B296_00030950 [Ensete ventricosum]
MVVRGRGRTVTVNSSVWGDCCGRGGRRDSWSDNSVIGLHGIQRAAGSYEEEKAGSNEEGRCDNKDGRGGWAVLEGAEMTALDSQAGRVSKAKEAIEATTGRGGRKRATTLAGEGYSCNCWSRGEGGWRLGREAIVERSSSRGAGYWRLGGRCGCVKRAVGKREMTGMANSDEEEGRKVTVRVGSNDDATSRGGDGL